MVHVTDHAALQYAKRVLGKKVEEASALISALDTRVNKVLDIEVLDHLFGPEGREKLKREIAHMCRLDFDPPNGHPILILFDDCRFIVKGDAVVTCLLPYHKCPEAYVTVVERLSRGRNLGRMTIQPPPISEHELVKAKVHVRREREREEIWSNGGGEW